MTSQEQFRNIVFLGTFIVIFWGCVFGRSAAVGLNAAFISTVLQRSAAASRLSEAVDAHTGWYSLWMGEIWRGSVCDGRARANHACFLMKQKQKHGVVYYSAPLAESGPLPAQIQNRSADQSCQVRRQQNTAKELLYSLLGEANCTRRNELSGHNCGPEARHWTPPHKRIK